MSAHKFARTELKHLAQEALMQGIATQLGTWRPEECDKGVPPAQMDELYDIMKREADRVAKLFGYEKAWTN
ncbi:hypothetical protein ACGFZC_16120 [[Kitasatospora] papulosa]|uniref:hypothetical protein n=1 Tax=[Kitasatospora] papulosa TaxID=1464011 RepID=UPI00370FBCD3